MALLEECWIVGDISKGSSDFCAGIACFSSFQSKVTDLAVF